MIHERDRQTDGRTPHDGYICIDKIWYKMQILNFITNMNIFKIQDGGRLSY